MVAESGFEPTISSTSAAPLLTRQVLPLESARLLGRQPSCPTATDQTHAGAHRWVPVSRYISEGRGDSGARWHLWDFFANAANHWNRRPSSTSERNVSQQRCSNWRDGSDL